MPSTASARPWEAHKHWPSKKIPSGGKAELWGAGLFALLWNGIIALSFINKDIIAEIQREGWLVMGAASLFPITGLFLFVWFFRVLYRYLCFGKTIFHLDTLPGVIGGTLEGRVIIPKAFQTDGFTVQLNCLHKRIVRSGSKSRTKVDILWQREMTSLGTTSRTVHGQSTIIPVRMGIPYHCRQTDNANRRNQIIWQLVVKADIPGIDFSTQFDVPVFKTEASNPEFAADAVEPPKATKVETFETLLESAGLQFRPTAKGSEYYFPAGRHLGAAFIVLAFALAFGAVAAFLPDSFVIRLFFGFFFLVLVAAALDMFFFKSRVIQGSDAIIFTSGKFTQTEQRFAYDTIREIRYKRGMSSSTAGSQKLYYDLMLHTTDGKKIKLAKAIPSLTLAEQLVAKWQPDRQVS